MHAGWSGAYWVNFQVVGLPSASTIFSKAAPTGPQARASESRAKVGVLRNRNGRLSERA